MNRNTVPVLIGQVHRAEAGALERLLTHPRVKEIVRVRAHKVRAFAWDRIIDRRLDAQRAVWEVASSIDAKKTAKLKTEGVTLAYLSTGVRNRLFRQLRTDLGLKEVTVTDNTGRNRFELQPKLARAPFELALAQVDALADPCRVLVERESLAELQQAYWTAPMSSTARRVLEWRLAGTPGKEMARRLGRSGPTVYAYLREARGAVRDQMHHIRTGVVR